MHREHPSSSREGISEKERSARPRLKKTLLSCVFLSGGKPLRGIWTSALAEPPQPPRVRWSPGRQERAGAGARSSEPCLASHAGRGKATKSAFREDFNRIAEVFRAFYKQLLKLHPGWNNLCGRKGRTLGNSKLSSRRG